ncbi:MAG: hypothetical protein MUC42_16785, partial [Bryobacter sp.]|nr:hypothetical protein [Bryobacter sp.]
MSSTTADTPSGAAHKWRFSRVGGLDLVRLETAEDLLNLEHLNQKLWTALACPVKGLEFDEKTLSLIDQDNDGRVRAPEIIAAVKWACATVQDPAVLIKGGDSLPVSAIKDKALAESAKEILRELGKGEATAISLSDVANMVAMFSKTKFNGDGVVTPDSAGKDAETAQLISDIVATQGGVPDRSGNAGVDGGKLGAFFDALAAFDAWTKQAEADKAGTHPLGADTGAALGALEAVRKKVDDFFGRCRLAAFDVRAVAALNRQESEFLELAAKDLTVTVDEIASFPLAHVEPGRALPLKEGVNPAWAAAMDKFAAAVVVPLLGKDKVAITEQEWATLKGKFAGFSAWVSAKAGSSVEGLGIDRVRALLAGGGRAKVQALIA